jgi:propionyl-CoA synthetase
VVRDTGGHAVVLHWSMQHIMGMAAGSVWWSASDIGWVVGHSFTTYAPLLLGCATVLYEGKPVGTPDAAQYWRLIEKHRINGVFTAPTAARAIKQHDTEAELARDFDLSSLKVTFVAGERCDPNTLKWLEAATGRPVLDNWWQTETGWPISGNLVGLEGFVPVKHGSVFRPVPGYDLQVLDEESRESVPRGGLGQLVIKLPLPPGTLQTLLHNDERFLDAYMTKYPGYYDTGDAGIIDEDGYVHIMSRTDDVINVAAHRLSSGEMEEILTDHPHVAEAVVIGCQDSLRGQVPLGMVVLNRGCSAPMASIKKELVQMVRERIGPVACFKECVQVQRFPKTRSGKILRATLRKIADGQPYTIPPTVDDPLIFDEITQIVSEHSSLL